jgi:hypothetical protein
LPCRQRYVGRTGRAADRRSLLVDTLMEDASAARFRPTWQQALGRGLFLGALLAVLGLTIALVVTLVGTPPPGLWALPPVLAVAGVPVGVLAGRRRGTEITARGIRTATRPVEPWSRIVDLRAERRGARTVVSVYLESGASLQLAAPYSGELFAADPQFELKVFALANLWRSHRFGGVPC